MLNIQAELRPALPTVYGPKDYREFRSILEEMNRILEDTGIEHRFIMRLIAVHGKELSGRALQSRYKTYGRALRYSIVLSLTGYSYRDLARTVADSALFQWFTASAQVDAVRPFSKSTIERLEKLIPSNELSELIHDLNRAVTDEKIAKELFDRDVALKMDQVFADTTCVKTNIHFPVDWLLLRDATRTLIKAIILIRRHGLKHRIGKPEVFIAKMNKLCMEMTNTRKKKGARKKRKAIFRRMKKLMKTIESHAINYHRVLMTHWDKTDWTKLEAQQVLDRIDNVLNQLPQAIEQAHERIIGQRKVPNEKKILSLYEPGTRVIVRGKAGAEVEFGNALYLGEQAEGLIIDWRFIEEQPPADNKLVAPSLERINKAYGNPECYVADRGFDAPDSRNELEGLNIVNAVCPRSVERLKEKLQDEQFCLLQKRRAQTEARIAIFKNAYLGKPLRSKGFSNRTTRIEWCILTHNLWKLATMAAQATQRRLTEAA
jgi:hypothetical protein